MPEFTEIGRLRRTKPFRDLSAADWRAVVSALQTLSTQSVSGGAGFMLGPDGAHMRSPLIVAATGIAVQRFRIKGWLGDDYLVCRTWDGATEGDTDILVAKPWDLRLMPFHEQTVNGIYYDYETSIRRLADDGDATEWQVITPDYFTDAEVYAVKDPRGGTGVDFADWLSVDARAWAEE